MIEFRQIRYLIVAAEAGGDRMPVADLIRRVGITEQTFYRWKKQ